MKEEKKDVEQKNGPMQFFIGLVLLSVGLFWLSQSVMVTTNWFSWTIGGVRMTSGLTVIPLIVGVIWMFCSPKNVIAKVVSALGAILIVAAIIMSINFSFVRTSLFEFIIMILFIAAGSGLLLRTLFKRKDN